MRCNLSPNAVKPEALSFNSFCREPVEAQYPTEQRAMAPTEKFLCTAMFLCLQLHLPGSIPKLARRPGTQKKAVSPTFLFSGVQKQSRNVPRPLHRRPGACMIATIRFSKRTSTTSHERRGCFGHRVRRHLADTVACINHDALYGLCDNGVRPTTTSEQNIYVFANKPT